jgi:hypothetical protein
MADPQIEENELSIKPEDVYGKRVYERFGSRDTKK